MTSTTKTATTRRMTKREKVNANFDEAIAAMKQKEQEAGLWCVCGHSKPTHDVGFTCRSTACSCLAFKSPNTQPPAHDAGLRDDDDGLEMSDDSCGECGHPYKRGDETRYPECSRARAKVVTGDELSDSGGRPRFRIGQHVYWNDPDDGICSGYGTITCIGDMAVSLEMDGGGETEVLRHELSAAPSQPSRAAGGERAWTARDFDGELDGYPLLSPEGLAAIATDPEYQKRILACINSHKSLVAALRDILAYSTGRTEHVDNLKAKLADCARVARTALAQARDGE